MPQLFTIKEKEFQVVVWKYNDFEELVAENTHDIIAPEEYHHKKRQAEFLSTRIGLESISPYEKVRYLDTGKPVLEEGYVSFSHTANFSAIIKSNYPTGIDIEHKREKIKKIQQRFLHEEESWAIDQLDQLHVIWGAKEALYKIYDIPGLEFSHDLLVEPFAVQNEFTFKSRFLYGGKNIEHVMKCCIFDDIYLIYNLS